MSLSARKIRCLRTLDNFLACGMHQPIEMLTDIDIYIANQYDEPEDFWNFSFHRSLLTSMARMWHQYDEYCDDGKSSPLDEMLSWESPLDFDVEDLLDSLR